MPFFILKTNQTIDDETATEIKTAFGKAIELVPGKSEQYLLLEIQDRCKIYLRGSDREPIAYITASIFGNESHLGYAELTDAITRILQTILHIPSHNIYIKFDDIAVWSVAGKTIDRNQLR
ncbi:MAG: hypothetical protein IJ268_12580 [Proteobacteria bacterium]|nr:hypothetical protein [Pseudomonadota bacterium]